MPDGSGFKQPPARADAFLARVLPDGAKGLTILGDLHEEFHEISEGRGGAAARRWYWATACTLGGRYAFLRSIGALNRKEARGGDLMLSILADLRFGVRMLARTPGLSLIAILTIAFGVGLTTHMYSSVYGSVIRGPVVPGADRLYIVFQHDRERGIDQSDFPYRDYLDLVERPHGMESLEGFYEGTLNIAGDDGPPERFRGVFVTANTLRTVGVQPILGRVFEAGEDGTDVERRLVLAHHMWQSRYGGARDVLGSVVQANGEPAEIIGVMPEGFEFPFMADLWVNIGYTSDPERRRSQYIEVFGRIPDGSDPAAARASLESAAADLAATFPEDNEGIGFGLIPFTENYMPPQITAVMYVMLLATFGVLLIACANVANLLLARASIRAREVAIRTAMGASRFRVIRQMLSEALVIAIVGGALGVVVAWVGVGLLNRELVEIEKPYWIDIYLDGGALLFALAVTLVSSLAAGLYPALRASGLGIGDFLRDESRGSSSLRVGRFSNVLVVSEVAISCGLLIAAGLMIKSVANLRTMDLGFEPESVLTGRVGIFEVDYPTSQARSAFFEELEQRVEALPGVTAAALSTDLPGLGGGLWEMTVEGDVYDAPRDHPQVNAMMVTSGFFDAVGTPILQGRDFLPAEAWDRTDPTAIVNESFVATVLGGRDPIGMRVKIGYADSELPFMRIVGVVPDMFVGGGVGGIGDDRINPEQIFAAVGPYSIRFMSVVARTAGPPEVLAPDLRRVVSDLDPNVPVYDLYSLSDGITQATWAFGIFGSLFTIFGAAALFLAAVGLYGVMAFSVNQRRQEMGVRMALGAGPDRILRMVLRKGIVQLAIGIGIGLGIGFALSRPLAAVTFDVGTTDPTVYITIVITLGIAGLVASFMPARSATRADPMEAMRT